MLQNRLRHLLKTTKSNIKEVAREATDFGQSVVTEQKDKLAEIVHEYGQAAKAASERLDQEGHAALANRADELSSRLDRASTYLREKRVSEIYYDTEHFTRRRPEIVFGMMFAVGLVAARFLKASDRGVAGRRQLNIASEEYPYQPSAPASTVSPESENTREANMTDQPTIAELLKDLRDESTLLLREEIALAKKEIGEKISSTARNLTYIVAGALVAYCAITFLLLAISTLISQAFVNHGVSIGWAIFLGLADCGAYRRSGQRRDDTQGRSDFKKAVSRS